jgi:ribonucleotide reductase beta subunit family protein with ferritin-like domain
MSDILNKNDTITQNYQEPLLTETQRYTLHPIKYPKIWNMYKKQQALYWTSEEIDFSKDKADWHTLNENEKFFIKHILAFFASADGIVGINIMDNFSKEVKILEAQYAYIYQSSIESIHSEVYSLMIETYITNSLEKEMLFQAIETIPCIRNKILWSLKWTDPEDSLFSHRLIAFIITEGLFFSGSFCAIYWLKERGILPGLTKSNEFIARDEGMHTEFGCLLYSMIVNKIDVSIVHQMFFEAVEIETEFICKTLPSRLIGMNDLLMIQYIQYVADWLLTKLEYPKLYDVKNPFGFMDNLGMESRSNFFDERTSTYQKAHIFNTSKELILSDDF